MKRFLVVCALAALLCLAGCGSGSGASVGASSASSDSGAASSAVAESALASSPESDGQSSENPSEEAGENEGEKEATMLNIQVGDTVLQATLEGNSSAVALADLLQEGPITVSLHDYGNFEKVGPLPTSLPTNDRQITTAPGDVILYQGNQITIYYDVNSWSFTRLAKIEGATRESLLAVLGDGDVEATLSLAG